MAGDAEKVWNDMQALLDFAGENRTWLREAGLAEIGILFPRKETRIVHPDGERLIAPGRAYAVLQFESDSDVREHGNPFVESRLAAGHPWSAKPTAETEVRSSLSLCRRGLGSHHHRTFDELMGRINMPVALAASWCKLATGDAAAMRYGRLVDLREDPAKTTPRTPAPPPHHLNPRTR